MIHLCFWGILTYAYSQMWYHLKTIDITFQICTHTFFFVPLGNTCIDTLKTLYQFDAYNKQPIQSMSYKLVRYHYTYAPCPTPRNIGIPICIAQSINLSITMLCMLLFCFLFLSYRHQPCF
jgi:hypothetical protein